MAWRFSHTKRQLYTSCQIRKAYADNSSDWNAQRHYHAVIPLILRIVRRRSSGDISLVWVIGVWSCVIAMLPSSLQSPDPVLVVFGIVNSLFFSAVFLTVLYFHPNANKSTKADS